MDIVEVGVIDERGKKRRFDLFEEVYLVVMVLKRVGDDILFERVEGLWEER